MAREIGRSANHAEAADAGAAGHRRAARYHGMSAHPHVVRNLDLVVELAAVLDDRIGHRAAVDGRISAHFHVIAQHGAANLRNLHVFHPGRADVRRETKAIRPHHHAAMQDVAHTHHATMIDGNVRVNERIVADLRPCADKGIRQDPYPLAQPRASLDHHVGPDEAGRRHHGIRRHARARVDTSARISIRLTVEALRHAGEADIRIARDQPVATASLAIGANTLEVRRRHDDGAGLGSQRLRQVQWIGQERQVAGAGLVERRQAAHGEVGITHNLRAVLGGELTQCGCLHGGTS
ncbi:hypothetical protein D3C72_840440 [compost metagenome]